MLRIPNQFLNWYNTGRFRNTYGLRSQILIPTRIDIDSRSVRTDSPTVMAGLDPAIYPPSLSA